MNGVVNLNFEKKGKVFVVRMSGRLDVIASPNVEQKVFSEIHNGEHNIVFNLSEVDYLSSAGMRVLLSVAKKLRTLSGRLVLCEVTENVGDVLRMSGFDHILDIAPTEQDALRKFLP